jgi:hypothetical protein
MVAKKNGHLDLILNAVIKKIHQATILSMWSLGIQEATNTKI